MAGMAEHDQPGALGEETRCATCPLLPLAEGIAFEDKRTTLVLAATPALTSTSAEEHSALVARIASSVSALSSSGISLVNANLVVNRDDDTQSPSGYVILVSSSAPSETSGGEGRPFLGEGEEGGPAWPRKRTQTRKCVP